MTNRKIVNAIGLVILGGVVVLGLFLQSAYERRTEKAATDHLTTMLMLRESVLMSYFESLRSEATLWSGGVAVRDILQRLNAANDAEDQYVVAHFKESDTAELPNAAGPPETTSLNERVREFAEHHNYYDVFFISPRGDVLFSVAKEADLGTNLVDGPYADSGLGHLFSTLAKAGDNAVAIEDFSLHEPSNNAPAAFLGARVIADGAFIGVYAIQIPEQHINEIMQFSAGMGETGETYLVGEDGLMRSTSRFFNESTVLKSEVMTPTLENAFRDEEGLAIVEDYRGVPVYSAYRLFEFEGLRWALLAEQDVAEVEAPIIETRYWFAGAFLLLCLILLLMRFMLINIVLPSSLAALLGLSLMSMESQADD